MSAPKPGPGGSPSGGNAKVLRELRSRSRRSFLVGGAAAAGAWGILQWSRKGPAGLEPSQTLQQRALRGVMDWNASLSRAVFGERGLAPTYPVEQATRRVRVNGPIGVDTRLKLASWRLQVVGIADARNYAEYVPDVDTWVYESADDSDDGSESVFATATDTNKTDGQKNANSAPNPISNPISNPGGLKDSKPAPVAPEAVADPDASIEATPGLLLTIREIQKLPHVDLVTQLKCIEGWSQIVHWGGVRFSDFIETYKPATSSGRPLRFVGLETPSGEYYVGLERTIAMHPQTLLCYEINGVPLTPEHGAPLRLVTPLKYGIKQLKQIGKVTFTDERPKDYWAEQGYDWYAGL